MGLQAVSQPPEEEPPAIPARRDSLGKTSLRVAFKNIAHTIIGIYNLLNII